MTTAATHSALRSRDGERRAVSLGIVRPSAAKIPRLVSSIRTLLSLDPTRRDGPESAVLSGRMGLLEGDPGKERWSE